MQKNQWLAPLIAMTATLFMCVLLSACKTSHASSHSSEFYSDGESIIINRNNGETKYHVNGKSFTYEQLNDAQKKVISKIEQKLRKLENVIDIKNDEMEKWSDKMELVAERMEDEAEQLEESLNDIELNSHYLSVNEISKGLEIATEKMEAKMSILESKMKAIEIQMPKIDGKKLHALEEQAEEYKNLLIEIAETI